LESTQRNLNNTQNAKKHKILVSTIQSLKNTQFNILDKKTDNLHEKNIKILLNRRTTRAREKKQKTEKYTLFSEMHTILFKKFLVTYFNTKMCVFILRL
jgi:hypothetical protein